LLFCDTSTALTPVIVAGVFFVAMVMVLSALVALVNRFILG
jgi:hypothetical protein